MKKPATEPKFNQEPAQGDHTDDEHALNVDKEAKAHGTPTDKPIGGHGQGGAGH